MPLLLLLAAAGPAAAAETVDLTPKFETGQTARYTLWTLRQQAQRIEGEGIQGPDGQRVIQNRNQIRIEGELTWRIDRVHGDGSATATMTLDWLTATIERPGQDAQTVDSRRAGGPIEPMHRLLTAMTGRPLTVEVSADGRAASVSGVGAIQQAAGDDLDAPEARDFLESATYLATLPGAPEEAAPGERWRESFTWNREGGELAMETEFELAAVDSIAGIPVATVTARDRRMAFTPEPPPENAPPMTTRMTESDHAAEYIVDLTRGEVVGRNSVETRVIESEIELPGGRRARRQLKERVQSQVLRIEEGGS